MLGRATACWRARGASGAGRVRSDRADGWPAFAATRIVLVYLLARARRRRLLLICDASLALKRFAALAFERQTRVVCLASFATSFVVTLTLSDGIPWIDIYLQRRVRRHIQRPVDLAGEHPSRPVRSARSGLFSGESDSATARFAASARELHCGMSNDRSQPVTSSGPWRRLSDPGRLDSSLPLAAVY